jgi:Ca2+-binding EF-hand superfamily protein
MQRFRILTIASRLAELVQLEFLMQYRALLTQDAVAQLTAGLQSGHQLTIYNTLTRIANFLSIVEFFKSPLERRKLAQDIYTIFEMFINQGWMTIVLQSLWSVSFQVQFEALRIVYYLAPGPRVASTPTASPFHSRNMFFKKLIINDDSLRAIFSHLRSPNDAVREMAILCVGSLAADNWEARDHLLKHGVAELLLGLVSADTPLSAMRKLSWAFAHLVGVTHERNHLPLWAHVSSIVRCLGQLALDAFDEQILIHVLQALSFILPGLPDRHIIARLVSLLAHPNSTVQGITLRTLLSIAVVDDAQLAMIMHANVLASIDILARHQNAQVRNEALNFLKYLVGLKGRIQEVIDSFVVPHLLWMLENDNETRFKAAKVIKYLTCGRAGQIAYLADQGVVGSLCRALKHFKVYDNVLISMYGYIGPTYNFEFVNDALWALGNVLFVGDQVAQQTRSPVNKAALLFDTAGVHMLHSVLLALKESELGVNSWRRPLRNGELSVDQKVVYVLLRIKKTFDVHSGPQCEMSTLIESVLGGATSSAALLPRISIKTYFAQDKRIEYDVPATIDLKSIVERVQFKYSLPEVALTFTDSEGARIRIDTDATLATAIAQAQNRVLRLDVQALGSGEPVEWLQSTVDEFPSSGAVRSNELTNVLTNVLQSDLEEIRKEELKKMFVSLESSTHFTAVELEKLHKHWATNSANGEISKELFAAGLHGLGITDALLIEQYFGAFDRNKDGSINFKEFVAALSVVHRGSLRERLQFVFTLYDADNSGYLDEYELQNIFKSALLSRGVIAQHDELQKLARSALNLADSNRDGKISFEEFCTSLGSNELIQSSFIKFPIPIAE